MRAAVISKLASFQRHLVPVHLRGTGSRAVTSSATGGFPNVQTSAGAHLDPLALSDQRLELHVEPLGLLGRAAERCKHDSKTP